MVEKEENINLRKVYDFYLEICEDYDIEPEPVLIAGGTLDLTFNKSPPPKKTDPLSSEKARPQAGSSKGDSLLNPASLPVQDSPDAT